MVTQVRDLNMRVRKFGTTDLLVSEFGLGCARLGGIFKRDPAEFVELLRTALDGGINFFDTADIYSQGESETLLGRAFRGVRDRVVIASKAGYVLPSQRRLAARMKPFVRPVIRLLGISRRHLPEAVRGSLAQDFSLAHLRRSVEGSLRRLGTDYLDLFQLHSPPVEVVEPGEWVAGLEELKAAGKIRYYGVSCDSIEVASAVLRHGGVSALQVPVNLFERDFLSVLPDAKARGVAVVARECLANGLLVKNISDGDIRSYCQSDGEAQTKAAHLVRFRQLAGERGSALPELALRFVNELDGVSVALVGVSSTTQLDALLSSTIWDRDGRSGDIPNLA